MRYGILWNGLLVLLPVERPRGGEYHPLDPRVAHGLHNADRTPHVDVIVIVGIEDGLRHRDPRCQVIHAIHSLQQGPQPGDIAHVPPGEEHAPV